MLSRLFQFQHNSPGVPNLSLQYVSGSHVRATTKIKFHLKNKKQQVTWPAYKTWKLVFELNG